MGAPQNRAERRKGVCTANLLSEPDARNRSGAQEERGANVNRYAPFRYSRRRSY